MFDPLYVSDPEMCKRLGISIKDWQSRIQLTFERRGFPLLCPVTRMRYWPAVKDWLDRYHGLAPLRHDAMSFAATVPDGEVNYEALKPKRARIVDKTPA